MVFCRMMSGSFAPALGKEQRRARAGGDRQRDGKGKEAAVEPGWGGRRDDRRRDQRGSAETEEMASACGRLTIIAETILSPR